MELETFFHWNKHTTSHLHGGKHSHLKHINTGSPVITKVQKPLVRFQGNFKQLWMFFLFLKATATKSYKVILTICSFLKISLNNIKVEPIIESDMFVRGRWGVSQKVLTDALSCDSECQLLHEQSQSCSFCPHAHHQSFSLRHTSKEAALLMKRAEFPRVDLQEKPRKKVFNPAGWWNKISAEVRWWCCHCCSF